MKYLSAAHLQYARSILFVFLILCLIPQGISHAQSIEQQDLANDFEATATGTTTRVSVSSTGIQGNADSNNPSISADGRYVAFFSEASNFTTGDSFMSPDIFVRDRQTGKTTLVSIPPAGIEFNWECEQPSISANGRYIAFMINGIYVRDQQIGETTRVDISSDGIEGKGGGYSPSISADGRYIAFISSATNLVSEDTNENPDVFVRDTIEGTTTRVSVSSAGIEGNSYIADVSISGDGRYVAFSSDSSNLVPDDTNNSSDVFVRDIVEGVTTRVSVSSEGIEGNSGSTFAAISSDGQFIAFSSESSNLVIGDKNEVTDVFVHDRQSGKTTRVSVSSAGIEGEWISQYPSISADGRYVAFESYSSNLVSVDLNGYPDIFIHDRQSGETTRVSVSSTGVEGNSWSFRPSISADGQIVAFTSDSFNLVSGDVNQVADVFVHERGDGFSVSGSILNEDLTALTDVTINLLDAASTPVSSITNNGDGSYFFNDIPAGTYTLMPLKSGVSFSPASRSVTIPPDASNQDFTALLIGHTPASDEKLTASKVTFTWEAIPDAVSYKLQLSTNPNFSVILLNAKTTDTTYFFDSFLQNNTTYYWRVRPFYTNSKGDWLPTWNFTSMYALVKPTLTSPDHRVTLTIPDVKLAWEPVENATQYKVVIAKDALFQNKVTSFKTTNLTAMFTLPDGKYFWRVRALDPYGAKGSWSDYRIFKVSVP